MIEVIEIYKTANEKKLASMVVRYHDLLIKCDLCLFKDSHLWVRMPEMWIKKEQKKSFVSWPTKVLSDAFQAEVIKQVIEKTGITIEKAIEIRKAAIKKPKKKIDLNKK